MATTSREREWRGGRGEVSDKEGEPPKTRTGGHRAKESPERKRSQDNGASASLPPQEVLPVWHHKGMPNGHALGREMVGSCNRYNLKLNSLRSRQKDKVRDYAMSNAL